MACCNCNSVTVFQRIHDIATFEVYVIACDLEKSFIFVNTVEVTSCMHCLLQAKHIVAKMHCSDIGA